MEFPSRHGHGDTASLDEQAPPPYSPYVDGGLVVESADVQGELDNSVRGKHDSFQQV